MPLNERDRAGGHKRRIAPLKVETRYRFVPCTYEESESDMRKEPLVHASVQRRDEVQRYLSTIQTDQSSDLRSTLTPKHGSDAELTCVQSHIQISSVDYHELLLIACMASLVCF